MKDRKLVNGDYVSDGAGGWEYVETAETAVNEAIGINRGQWWGDGEAGSLLHLYLREGASDAMMRRAEEAIRSALSRLVAEKRITIQSVIVYRDDAVIGRVHYELNYIDLATGTPLQYADPMEV